MRRLADSQKMSSEEAANVSRLSHHRQQGFVNALLENVEDAIVACDAEGIISVFNHAAR